MTSTDDSSEGSSLGLEMLVVAAEHLDGESLQAFRARIDELQRFESHELDRLTHVAVDLSHGERDQLRQRIAEGEANRIFEDDLDMAESFANKNALA